MVYDTSKYWLFRAITRPPEHCGGGWTDLEIIWILGGLTTVWTVDGGKI